MKIDKISSSRLFTIWSRKDPRNNFELEFVSLNKFSKSVMIAFFPKEDHILLVRKYFPTDNKFKYTLPGGKVEKGDTSGKTARRELKEECGYTAKKYMKLISMDILPGYFVGSTVGYMASGIKDYNKKLIDTVEIEKSIVISLNKGLSWIREGKITDVRTIALILFINSHPALIKK